MGVLVLLCSENQCLDPNEIQDQMEKNMGNEMEAGLKLIWCLAFGFGLGCGVWGQSFPEG